MSENLIFDEFFRHDAVLAPHQELQHRSLAAGQDLWFVIDECLPAFGVERQIAYLQRTPEQLARSAQKSFQSGKQLFEIEGLHQIVIGAGAKTVDAIMHAVPSR